MKLKTVIDDPVEVIGPLRECYTKRDDGKFVLALDGEPPGYVPKSTHDEFRTNNRTLNTKVIDLEAKLKTFDGIDPVAAQAAFTKLATLEGIDPEEYNALKTRPDLSDRVTALEAELATERGAKVAAQRTADGAVFRSTVSDVFVRAGGREDALDFIVSKAKDIFGIDNGVVTTREFSTARPGEPLTIEEWVAGQTLVSGFAFKPSSGGGASGSRGAVPAKRTISGGDAVEFGRNIESIAKGEITVSN